MNEMIDLILSWLVVSLSSYLEYFEIFYVDLCLVQTPDYHYNHRYVCIVTPPPPLAVILTKSLLAGLISCAWPALSGFGDLDMTCMTHAIQSLERNDVNLS